MDNVANNSSEKTESLNYEDLCKSMGFTKEEVEANPLLKSAVDKIMTYNTEAGDNLDKVMHIVQGMLRNGNNIFSVYLMLTKCINFTSQVFCNDYNDFMDQMKESHQFVDQVLFPLFEHSSPNNSFDIRKMLFTASAIIEYLIWTEASGELVLQDNTAEKTQDVH